ncbi:50S ribosomal protein L20 [Patescibacteria group bacterium]|nr:50S ribosomal protein L20 [Patescibacteria group bacterium]MBU1921950.1 50S ribosomal protein L20 [Patescibacteria group bacterium]
MPRVKRGKAHLAKRKKLLKKTKGYKWGRKKLIKIAKTAVTKAGAHAYSDRRKKKRTRRALWLIKINAGLRKHGLTYSKFMGALKKKNIEIDRKILAQLAENEPKVFKALIEKVK